MDMHHHPRNAGRWRARARAGFTLMEVLIVIAIILALGGLVLMNLMPAKEGADKNIQLAQFDQIDGALKMFKLDMKRWPNEDEGLAALMRKDSVTDEAEAANWKGPYLESNVLKDVWKHDITYRIPSEKLGDGYYDLVSAGPDGQQDTSDDITNHDRMKNAEGEIEAPSSEGADTFAPPPSGG